MSAPAAWQGDTLRLGDETIHYVEAGQGEPLLLVHGFFAWSFTWRKNMAALGVQFRTTAIDLRGFGLSQRGARLRYGLDDQADLLAAFLEARGQGRVALIGHSMGGEVALRFALRYPDRVKGLVLVAPSALVQRQRRWEERYLVPLPVLGPLALRLSVLNRRFAARSVREAYYRPNLVTPEEIAGYLHPASVPGSARSLAAILQQVDFGAAAGRLGEVRQPTLIIWGENDPWVPVAHAHRLRQLLPNSELVTFPDCGHVPPEEQPDRFHQVVIPFLDRLG